MTGLEGTDCEMELIILKKTTNSYLLENDLGDKFWLPKSCFDKEDVLTESGEELMLENLERNI